MALKEAADGSGTDLCASAEETEAALAMAVIVHDLRTPLGAVSATADLLAATTLDARQRSYVETLQEATAALNDLAGDLLEQAGEVPPPPRRPVAWNPAETLASLACLFAPLADRRGVQLCTDIAQAADRTVLGDPHAVRRILTNLLENAVKFTSTFATDGTVRFSARVAEESDPPCLIVSVADDGPGIPPGEREGLFRPYRQGACGLTLRSGSGLGLWISRTLALRLGGRLEVDDNADPGTRFVLEVPCPSATTVAMGQSADEPGDDASPAPKAAAGLNVLVVDDNSVNRLLITTFLDSFGMRFKAVDGGAAALTAAATEHFDVVIMDLQMPDMDGIETASRLREMADCAGVPIIALTAGMRPSVGSRSRQAGFVSVLSKPFAPGDLLNALNSAAMSTKV